MTVTLHQGDCLDALRGMADNSVDSIVTDPPYGLSFMGKRWDSDVPAVEVWAECLRVLKPGGHLLAFAGTRTQHRMAVRIEDAGFEIRDMIAWVYGSGFPKSLDVSKALDKAAGAQRNVVGYDASRARPNRLGAVMGDAAYDRSDNGATVTAPATEDAQQWQGWGTALKPSLEPITVARKPLIGTVAANVLEHGTGALNIDGCRVYSHDSEGYAYTVQRMMPGAGQNSTGKTHQEGVEFQGKTKDGRWPANLIHDGSYEVLAGFPVAKSGSMKAGTLRAAQDGPGSVCYGTYGGNATSAPIEGSEGSAARFFYCAKASRADRNDGVLSSDKPAVGAGATMREREDADWTSRNGNHHPTVKPTDLMRYLCRLVTPPGGVVLDPFMGSGSTGKATMLEGFQFVGCELSPEYLEIARSRIEAARTRANEVISLEPAQKPKPRPVAQGQNDLFEGTA